ncbi:protein trichome birefringence-like 2 [Senna tora]|uniref:Protein trichome birefringence-like 2 n=1 Tax=Senna tora TaxID=362788 RepID=A0A834W4P4_9FABA|nr:protein trichome birefringence-like 2 [Senna tora]
MPMCSSLSFFLSEQKIHLPNTTTSSFLSLSLPPKRHRITLFSFFFFFFFLRAHACMHVLVLSSSMDLKRLPFPEPFLTPRRKVVSLCFVVSAYLLIFTLLLHNHSAPVSKINVLLNPIPSCSSSFNKTPQANASVLKETTPLRNFTHNVKTSSLHVGDEKPSLLGSMEAESPKNSSFSTVINNVANASHGGNSNIAKKISFYEECDIFEGKWVRDESSKPYYPLGSCPHIDRDFNCHLNGRPDSEYVKWKWQPNECDIPRNMWESMVCIFRQSIRDKKRVYEISGRTEFKKKGFYAFRFEDYNCSVDFVSSPFLVRESSFKGKNGSLETLRLDLMDRTTTMYRDADIIVFNTGHWWTHEKTSRGKEYYQEGKHVHPRMEVLDAYRRALTTWAKWVDRNINANRTQVFFRGYSVTHFRGGQWNSGGQCHKETKPIFNETYLQDYPSKMRVVEQVIQKMRIPVMYMNISRLTDYRKDGHPSIYRMEYKSETERNNAERFQDCSHWCLPGVPDAWNELLYASLLQHGKGTWTKP